MKLTIEEIDFSQIDSLKSLWAELNKLHIEKSNYFKEHYKTFTFEERLLSFSNYESDKIKIDVLMDKELYVGYCISTISDNCGEIDSLFISSKYRKYGSGKKLVERSISWLKYNNCKKIVVSVAEGNESVFDFYKEIGFYPRLTQFQLK